MVVARHLLGLARRPARLERASRRVAKAGRDLVDRLDLIDREGADLDVAAMWTAVAEIAGAAPVERYNSVPPRNTVRRDHRNERSFDNVGLPLRCCVRLMSEHSIRERATHADHSPRAVGGALESC
ncbi:hypothetical protein GCM10023334_094460 [Nonomuraea thailandensis]